MIQTPAPLLLAEPEVGSLPGERHEFLQWTQDALERDGMVAVIVMRLKRFRPLKLEFGYAVGDQVVEATYRRLQACLRPRDRIARLATAEFALLLPELRNPMQPHMAVAKIQRECQQALVCAGESVNLSLAFGVSLFPAHSTQPAELLRMADQALEQALREEQPFVIYDQSDGAMPQTLGIERELQLAVEDNALDLVFQPKVDLTSARFSGVEALSRWSSNRFGSVSPDIFIETAEQSDLIVPLTLWSLNAALREATTWRNYAPLTNVAVNLSPRLFAQPELPALVAQALQIWEMDHSQLTLEVTEGALMRDPKSARECMAAIHDLGVRISIDDFGTGYSSLAYLKNLPVDELKIDKSFVMNMVNDEGDRSIVRSVTDLAMNFGLAVVAEGVEDPASLEMLSEYGCMYAQGFYISKPLSTPNLEDWLVESNWYREA